MLRYLFRCGPLAVTVTAPTCALRDKVLETARLYDVEWKHPGVRVALDITEADAPARMVAGSYLTCARMRVDATASGLLATCPSGASAAYSVAARQWSIAVPRPVAGAAVPEDVEDLIGLVLVTGWRHCGWVPLHAAAVVRDGCCALVGAPSGGGKTTLTVALVRRGWDTLGDDKLLLRIDDGGRPELRALLHNMNLPPLARQWFPEVGDLERLPVYSAWTDKRKVRIEDMWPGSAIGHARPTHLVQMSRRADIDGVRVGVLPRSDILPTLLRQTVIPHDRPTARHVLTTLAAAARQIDGLRIDVGSAAYRNPDCLAALEGALR